MFEEFEEEERAVLLTRGYAIVEGIARKSYDTAWDTVKKIEGKIYHDGKDPYGNKFNLTYDNFDQWDKQTK